MCRQDTFRANDANVPTLGLTGRTVGLVAQFATQRLLEAAAVFVGSGCMSMSGCLQRQVTIYKKHRSGLLWPMGYINIFVSAEHL